MLLLVCTLVVLASLALDVFNWMVALAVLVGVNANQIHKWSHRTRHENGRFVVLLQRAKLIQSPAHHHRHHTHGKDSNYCVLTDFLNPVLDGIGFWRGLEWTILHTLAVKPRNDEQAALQVLAREPEFFGDNLDLVRERVRRAAPHP